MVARLPISQRDLIGLFGLFIPVGLATLFLSVQRSGDFAPYFGNLPAPVVILIVFTLAAVCAVYLHRAGRLPQLPNAPHLGYLAGWLALVLVFFALAVGADMGMRYPKAINVPWPWAWLFYPTMALVAETIFHLVPIALLLWLLSLTGKTSIGAGAFFWLIAPIALLEPAFHLRAAFSVGGLSALEVFTGFNVLAINLCQLRLFTRHGLLAMIGFRLAYYLLWHIIWGAWRLEILF